MVNDGVTKYLASSIKTPYFLFVSDGVYSSILKELSILGLTFIYTSDYCNGIDKIPDIDRLVERIKNENLGGKNERLVILGLGEYLALRGTLEAESVLSRIKDLSIGDAKTVLILRGLSTKVEWLKEDLRFDIRRFTVVEKAECNLSFTLVSPLVGLSALKGFKALLLSLEYGMCGQVTVNTLVELDKALLKVNRIDNAFDGVVFNTSIVGLKESNGSNVQWAELLSELTQSNGSIDAVFERYSFNTDIESNFHYKVAGIEYRNWVYFIALKSKVETLSNNYLQFVLEKTICFEEFKVNLLCGIISVSPTDIRFKRFYSERKTLLKEFPESDIANFVINNRIKPQESLYRLTDKTKTEREEIIAWITRNGIDPQVDFVYPALSAYMKMYVFNCGELSSLLTDYFVAYKRQKILNSLENDFLVTVDELALKRSYNRLATRSEIIDNYDREGTFLLWLDAFGVEYLAYVSELAHSRGLSISVNIVRSELPTITKFNRGFFDEWIGKKEKNDSLDEIKHKESGGYNFLDNRLPIHLAKELETIALVFDRISTELAMHNYKRFLIVSDHGASRLAILHRKEEKYQTDTQGENSGRCCKKFEPYDLPFAADENGYLVLADYGRFKGSRAANVEVHGGASLEEVVVPIIEIMLKDIDISVKLVEESVIVDFRKGIEITLFFNSSPKNVAIVLNGKRYSATVIDRNHYNVLVPDIRRAGDYSAEVYVGDDLVDTIIIKAVGKSGKINEVFDEYFKEDY